ncbi:uncharacterized protein [Littorina saxatilis]|uniref:uncharacterized protein n=1 Tax=Littorina saxatilis TaxID=31220 RepID=UPI0038B6510F
MAAFGTPAGVSNWQSFRSSVDTCPISLNNSDTVKFIQQYQQQELLWNVNLPDHTNKAMRSECLMKLSHIMGLNWTEQQVKDKILSLRSRYSKELVKVRVSIAAGAEHYTPVWRFFPLLDSFLRPFCTTRKTNTPTVRAFHQRLMAASVGQPLHSSSSPIQASHAASAAPSSHFHSTPALSSSYRSNYQNAPVSNNGYQDDNDDDVQIVEEEYAGEMMQEDSVYIDDDDDEYSNESNEQPSVENGDSWGNRWL